ncbi:hypothetical protein [Leucobacter insecticola]
MILTLRDGFGARGPCLINEARDPAALLGDLNITDALDLRNNLGGS